MKINPYTSPQPSVADSNIGRRSIALWRRIVGLAMACLGAAIFARCVQILIWMLPGRYVSEETITRTMIVPIFSAALALGGVWIGFTRRVAAWASVAIVLTVLFFEVLVPLSISPVDRVRERRPPQVGGGIQSPQVR